MQNGALHQATIEGAGQDGAAPMNRVNRTVTAGWDAGSFGHREVKRATGKAGQATAPGTAIAAVRRPLVTQDRKRLAVASEFRGAVIEVGLKHGLFLFVADWSVCGEIR
jgi:hypothetical protein